MTTHLSRSELSQHIKAKALELGFTAVGIIPAAEIDSQTAERLEKWLENKHHAEMQWMENYAHIRKDPRLLLENAKSIVCVALNYFNPDEYESTHPSPPPQGGRGEPNSTKISLKIAKYARGTDYHKVVKDKLRTLLKYIQTLEPNIKGRALTDSAPMMEKPLAIKAGLGWMGRNGNIILPKAGSFVFIGELFLDAELSYDNLSETLDTTNQMPSCGTCTKCIEACPTDAILFDENHYGVVDANQCISYWTIEYKGESFPKAIQQNLNGWIFGCDICQDVCPWNLKFATPTIEPLLQPRAWNRTPTAEDLLNLTDDEFKERYVKSPIKRTQISGLKRNVREAQTGMLKY